MLIADRGNNRMLLVDSAKHIYWQYPKPGVTPAMPFRFDDDTFFGPGFGRIISNQEEQHTIQIISFPGGHVLWRYGHVNGKGSAPGYLNTPDDAYLLRNGLVTVADAYNCRVLFINKAHRIVRQYGTTGICRHNPPRELGSINGATPLADGGTLVSEINGSWIDEFAPDGRLRWTVQAPVSYPSDPQLVGPNRILLADYARPGHAIIMTRRGRVLWRYGPSSGPGELDHPSLAMQIAPNLIAINDDYRHRVVLVAIRQKRIVWQYGHTDTAGRAPGYLNTPDGLDLLRTADAQLRAAVRALLRPHRAASRAPRTQTAPPGSISAPVHVAAAGFSLPAPVQREVAVPWRGGVLIAGGLDSAGQSASGVFTLDPRSGRLTHLGAVPEPFHDAAGALLGNRLYVFGGGASKSSATVQVFDPITRRGRVASQLPHPLSDVTAAGVGKAVYLIGGYDDHAPRNEIYRTTDGTHFELAGRLPSGLRYTAAAAAGTDIVIVGGIGAHGAVSTVYRFDTTRGRTSLLGHLPAPLAHASAVNRGGALYVLGGSNAQGQTLGTILRIDPRTGAISTVAATQPVSDTAAARIGNSTLFIGGARGNRATARIVELRG